MKARIYLEGNIIVDSTFNDIEDTGELSELLTNSKFIVLSEGMIPVDRILYIEKTED